MSSSKYEKSYVHEEEGSYHRREIEPIAPQEKSYTTHHETTYQIAPRPSSKTAQVSSRMPDTSDDDDDAGADRYEQWTTSKRKINHKTRQVETRVSRQLLVEDGKVIADSGPQVITRIKEDNKVEECEKERAPKNKSKFDAISSAPESGAEPGSGRVLGEKKEIQRVSREVREENMQYHDERFKELTGHDVHRRAIQAPHELITITDQQHSASAAPRGKMVHYSNKGKKYQDTDEILEVAKLAIDGSITKEVKRTRHHEECSEDELPDEKGEAEALRDEPIVTRSSRRHVDYVNDFDDTATPSCSSDDDDDDDRRADRHDNRSRHHQQRHGKQRSSGHRHTKGTEARGGGGEEAFPRYEIDPLLNSLRDEDFRPISADRHSGISRSTEREVPLSVRRGGSGDHYSGVDHERRVAPAVEIPEEYRVNRQRLASGKGKQHGRERSFSPQPAAATHRHRAGGHAHPIGRDHDASVQAHLTDEVSH